MDPKYLLDCSLRNYKEKYPSKYLHEDPTTLFFQLKHHIVSTQSHTNSSSVLIEIAFPEKGYCFQVNFLCGKS